MATKKLTAGNSLFLARVKAVFNHLVFAKVVEAANQDGEEWGREVLCSIIQIDATKIETHMIEVIAIGYEGKRDRLPRLCR